MNKKIFFAAIIFSEIFFGCSKSTDPSPVTDLHTYKVLPQATDNAILESNKPHLAFIDKGSDLKDKLMVFIGGTDSAPSQYQLFSKTAASLGYHVIDISYVNSVTTLVCKNETDTECFVKFHEEIIFGGDESAWVEVDVHNSIMNRIMTLLQYLHTGHPEDGWNNFYVGDDLDFSKCVFAGHSQGGGHATYLAHKHAINRLIVFCSPSDYSVKYASPAEWCTGNFATTPDRFYGLMHKRDDTVPPDEEYAIWESMNLVTMSSDTSSADRPTYKNYHALYTDFNASPDAHSHSTHNVPVMDATLPGGADGEHLKEVWKYFLGN